MTMPLCRTISPATNAMRAMFMSRSSLVNPRPLDSRVRTTSPSSSVTSRPPARTSPARACEMVDFSAPLNPVSQTHTPVLELAKIGPPFSSAPGLGSARRGQLATRKGPRERVVHGVRGRRERLLIVLTRALALTCLLGGLGQQDQDERILLVRLL